MNKLLSPYRVGIEKSILHITFDRIVTADVFFANCADIQHILEDGAYNNQAFQQLYIDFSKTTWFDTLALCYMLMFTDCAKKRNNTLAIHFYFSETNGTEYPHQLFWAFLSDNGFLAQMEKIGKVYNYGIVPVLQYSQIHRCIWPLQIFYQPDEIGNNIDIIKKHLHDELSDTLNSYELENVTSKVTYFLQETVDNAFKHGYGGINAGGDEFHSRCTPCMLLIKRVKSCDTLDFKEYSVQYTEHTPYINISLFKEKQEYLEVYVADIGVGLRRSFLQDPDGAESGITDENIMEYILTNGERSRKKIGPVNTTRYGGLYDIMTLFQEDGDKIGFKCDSRWFFDTKSRRINERIMQGQYQGLSHGFAIIGNISWKKRLAKEYPFVEQIIETVTRSKDSLYQKRSPWMKMGYQDNIWIQDDRFPEKAITKKDAKTFILFPAKNLEEKKIISGIVCDTVIISGIHESEYKRYKSLLMTLNISKIRSTFQKAIVITNTLFPYVFSKKGDRIVFSEEDTLQYIQAKENEPITESYLSFRLWKKVYDSEQLWDSLSIRNSMGYINAPIIWNGQTLRGYLDFSQLCLIPECRNLCIEQLMGFQLGNDRVYFHSLDRFTDEICELANHLMDNSKDGKNVWIGSVFVSGTSERKISSSVQVEEDVFYFFGHVDCQETSRKTYTLFEWTTVALRIDNWFPPAKYENKNYARVGNSSFVAAGGSGYWASRHYVDWEKSYYLRQEKTYRILQKQFGARPALLKMGHFDATDHHDLFELEVDKLVDADIMSSQIILENDLSSFDFLLLEFFRALGIFGEEEAPGTSRWRVAQKKDGGKRSYPIEGRGILVYLNDYQTSKIIESISPWLPAEARERVIPIIPIEKSYASSTLLISPLLLDALEQKIQSILDDNKQHYGQRIVHATIFIATAFTTRLQDEIKHILFRMGVSQVRMLSIFDRQRLPFGSCSADHSLSYARLDLPAVGVFNTCPICRALQILRNLQERLQDDLLLDRILEIVSNWEAVKSSDNHYKSGISVSYISLPEDIQQALKCYEEIYKQGQLSINTNLGLSLFAIENTVISLGLDFIDLCLNSAELDASVKLLLMSSHLLIFSELQLSEKYFCHLLDQLCDLLEEQTKVTEFTALAVVAICGQPCLFQRYSQRHMIERFREGHNSQNNDSLLLKLAIYLELSQNDEIEVGYLRELRCHLKNEKSALALIYDLFLYTETDYKQSHRQAFSQIRHSSMKRKDEIYQNALKYAQKLKSIYNSDLVRGLFHNPNQYIKEREWILQQLEKLETELTASDAEHQLIQHDLIGLLDVLQELHKGLYLRTEKAVGNRNIAAWLDYCESCAKKRARVGKEDTLLKIINGYTGNYKTEVCPWFFAYADVTEEVINLLVDMMQRSSQKLRNFLQGDDKKNAYDRIIMVQFQKEYVELSFYNATVNQKSIEEIRYIKRSKENRPSMIAFRQFERMISDVSGSEHMDCFEWNYADEVFPDCLSSGEPLGESEHLFQAIMRIPYVDMGSSFSW